MSRRKRALLLVVGAASVVLALLLLAPWFLNTKVIEQQVRAVIAERTGRSVSYEKLAIAFFPRPHLDVDAFRLSLPGMATARIASLQVYPEVLPLFTGSIRLAKVSMVRPEVAVDLASLQHARPAPARRGPDASGASEVMTALSELRSFAPDLVWVLDGGTLALGMASGETLALRNVRGRLHLVPKGFDLEIRGNVDRWGKIAANGRLQIERTDDIAFLDLSLASGRSSITGLTARFTRNGHWRAEVRLDGATLRLEELYRQATAFEALQTLLPVQEPPTGTITLIPSSYAGPLERPARGSLDLRGSVKDLSVRSPALPDTLRIPHGEFTSSTRRFKLANVRIESADATAIVDVAGSLALPALRSADLALSGTIGPRAMSWIVSALSLPPERTLRTPLSISQGRVTWERNGATAVSGVMTIQDGPTIGLNMRRSADELSLEQLEIADAGSAATLSFRYRTGLLDVRYHGELSRTTMGRLFARSAYDFGSVAGTLDAHIDLARPQISRARGTLQADHIIVPGLLQVPIEVRHAALHAEQDRVVIDNADIAAADQAASLSGTVTMAREGFLFDADLRSQTLAIDTVVSLFLPAPSEARQEDAAPRKKPKRSPPFSGSLRWNIGLASYGTFTVQPLITTIGLAPDRFDIQFTEAAYCGISLTGSLGGAGKELSLSVRTRSAGIDLEPALACMAGKDLEITGTTDLTMDIAARAPPRSLLDGLAGTIVINARDGRILKSTMMTRLLALLNVTDILRGEYKGREKGGIRYRSLAITADLKQRSLTIRELVLDSEVMDLTAHGSIQMPDRTLDITMLVAPIKAGNWLVKKIPLVRDILDGTLITIPVRATGPVGDPKLSILPPSAVGEGLLGITKRTLQLPFKIIEPVVGGKKRQDE